MIERQLIDGKAATVAYLKDGFEPGTRDDYDMVKIVFDDGKTIWAKPQGGATPAATDAV